MKVAIFHDYMEAIGGAERLVLTLSRALDADIITTNVNSECIKKIGFPEERIISLGTLVPDAPFKQMHATARFALSRFDDYDFYIFSGNWSHYAAIRHKPNLMYCHTPVRIFYDLKDYFLMNQKTEGHRMLAKAWISLHGHLDRRSINNIDKIVVNSQNTRRRVKRYYNRDAVIIYPPIATRKFKYISSGSYWLSVNRLYPEKRIPLQIEAFRKIPEEELRIVGGYSESGLNRRYLSYLCDKPSNVVFLGTVSDEALADLYGRCKGLICTSIDEDFGMAAVEAMAAGKPVIAVAEGGYLESLIDGVTGSLIEASTDRLVEAVKAISGKGDDSYRDDCRKRAELFDEEIFVSHIKEVIEEC